MIPYLLALSFLLISAGVAAWKYKMFALQESPLEPLEEPPQAPTSPVTTPTMPEPTEGPKKLELAYEAQPFHVTQEWGIHDPATYSRFGFTDHNGIDIAHGYNSRIRAPFDYHIIGTLWQPNGGGMVLSIRSKDEYENKGYVRLDYLHLSKYVKTSGDGKTGDLLCIAGNTGYSTGPHTHIKATWVDEHLQELDTNKADNTFNQLPYYTGKYAVDYV